MQSLQTGFSLRRLLLRGTSQARLKVIVIERLQGGPVSLSRLLTLFLLSDAYTRGR